MKKILFIGFVLVGVTFSTNAQTGWFKKKLDDRISVQFPAEPEAQGPAFKYKDKDSVGYTAAVTDFSMFGADSAMIAAETEKEEFADQLKEGFSAQIPDLEITKSETGKWNGYPAYNYEGEIKPKAQKMYFTCIIVGAKMYAFVVAGPSELAAKNKDTFFKSVTKE